jgi:hypothetical protein
MSGPDTTLGLVGDGDELGLIADVENSLGIDLKDAPPHSIRTVGDLYRCAIERYQLGPRTGNVDSTVRAYRALLPILQRYAGRRRRIAPSTHLSEIFSSTEYRRALIEIARLEKWRMPRPTLNSRAETLALGVAASLFLGMGLLLGSLVAPDLKQFAWYAFLGTPVFGALAWIATVLGGYSLSGEKYTVGWLARGVAALNYNRFSNGRFEARDVWNAVRRMADEHKESDCEVVPETTIITK